MCKAWARERQVQATGGFPVDLVLFAMIAAFLVLRLRSILGKRTGFEGAPAAPARPAPRAGTATLDGHAEPAEAARALPDPAGPVGRTMVAMHGVDRRFDPAQFLAGAEHAFRLIVDAFAAGDRARLRPLLTEATFHAFEGVIAAREAAGETQRTEIRAIEEATITDATLSGTLAAITVRFVSRQVNISADRAGNPVSGTDAVTEISDLWRFERDLAGADLTWRLSAARST
jgi:predicted lipid-binding transport protein (Tim44 family)